MWSESLCRRTMEATIIQKETVSDNAIIDSSLQERKCSWQNIQEERRKIVIQKQEHNLKIWESISNQESFLRNYKKEWLEEKRTNEFETRLGHLWKIFKQEETFLIQRTNIEDKLKWQLKD